MEETWLTTFWKLLAGLVAMLLGQLAPVKDIVHLLVFLFIADMLVGWWAAVRVKGEKFSAKVIWRTTIPRLLISLLLIIGAFLWDNVYEQNVVATYKLIGWFISGVLLANIAQNGYRITKWDVFFGLADWLRKKLEEHDGPAMPEHKNE